jgi:hypothetical protein
VNLAAGVEVLFTGEKGSAARVDLDIAKSAFVLLTERWPRRTPFRDLLREAAGKLGREPSADDGEKLADVLSKVWATGMVDLHGNCPQYSETVSDRPVASPLARLQVQTGEFATTMLHESMRFEDAPGRLLLELLDGTNDHEQLAEKVSKAFPPEQRPDPAALRDGLERNLERLAKAGLLIG